MSTELPFDDRADVEDADRGFIAALEPGVVTDASGRVVWDGDAYAFVAGDCPATANPSLWRQAQLVARQGLYEVARGVYQVRGLDLSNMTIVEGDTGVVVIDPLISAETAAAALGLYRAHRGERPVSGVVYTHSHVDHFGGAGGLFSGGVRGVTDGGVPILAPEGFLEHAAAENVYAGTAMARRAAYMYGSTLPKGPAGQIGCELGMTTSTGTVGLLPPTVTVTHTGQDATVDGVRMVFQVTPGTEAPAEMNFLLPEHRALCVAENATHNLHNILTLRGALVRDARAWSRYLTETIALFADRCDVVFASHHWPTWGGERITRFLTEQRDLYAYLHDQTLRLLNAGYTGPEIAEVFELPPGLDRAWHARGYYGSVSHNVKAVYQRYLGWFDGNPAHLWAHPPRETAARYVDCLGGVAAVLVKAREYLMAGDVRFAAQLLNDAVFAEPEHPGARELLAQTYERLAYGAENGTWRNFYLTGAKELRDGITPTPTASGGAELAGALSVEQIFHAIAVRVDGPRAARERLRIDWTFVDLGETHRMTLSNGVLVHHTYAIDGPPELVLRLTKPQLLGLLAGQDLDGVDHSGDIGAVTRLLKLLDEPDPDFAIVTR